MFDVPGQESHMTQLIGRAAGVEFRKQYPVTGDIRVDLTHVTQLDVEFVREALIRPILDIHEDDRGLRVILAARGSVEVQTNIRAAVDYYSVPIHASFHPSERGDDTPYLFHSNDLDEDVYREVVDGLSTASQVAKKLDISVSSASNRLRKLWTEHFVVRSRRKQESGGYEYAYRVPAQ